jgi:hypothetical protein
MHTIFNKQTNEFWASTCCPIKIVGNKMTNGADYSPTPNRKGVTNTYTIEVKGNTLHQRGRTRGQK